MVTERKRAMHTAKRSCAGSLALSECPANEARLLSADLLRYESHAAEWLASLQRPSEAASNQIPCLKRKSYQMALWGLVAASYCVSLMLMAGPFKPDLNVHLTVYKVGHVAGFAVLGLIVAFYFRREFGFSVLLGVTLTLLACAFFGGLVELYQFLVPGRSPELRDITLDSIGAFAGAIAYGAHRMTAAGTRFTPRQANSVEAVESTQELLERR
ncbi:MAG: VanZ family protein [Desulfomonile tiedjei]|nr:VanZ family protein [Desulfomonile tiedjei]